MRALVINHKIVHYVRKKDQIPHCCFATFATNTTHPFNGPLSGTTQVSRYQTGKTSLDVWILLKQETVSGSGISWAICKSAPCSRQTTTPAPYPVVYWGVYGVYQPPGFFWQRILTSVIINKQCIFRPCATPLCVYPPPFLAIHHWPYHSAFHRPDDLPAAQPTASKHWRLPTQTA